MAVLRRSDKDVLRALKKTPSSLHERNVHGQTPLHLAVGWPWGIRLLLDAGADYNASDFLGWAVLSYACSIECLDTIQYLLEKQATFVGYDSTFGGKEFYTTMSLIPSTSDQRIVDQILFTFVERRRRLIELAREFLAEEQVDQSKHETDEILDVDISYLYELLSTGVSVPAVLDTRIDFDRSVYHLAGKNTVLATKFWDLGFHNVEAHDGNGQTPLMSLFNTGVKRHTLQLLKQAIWLTAKGASMFTRGKDGRVTAARRFAEHMGYFVIVQELGDEEEAMNTLVEQLRRDAGLDAAMLVHDSCICRCSFSGCTAHTSFVRGVYKRFADWRYPRRSHDTTEWWIKTCIYERRSCIIVKQVFRAIVFELLQLRHTCCDRPGGYYEEEDDQNELEEIHDEQAEDYVLLETLVELALSQWTVETRPFSEFIEEFVETQIKSREGPPSEEYVKQLEEIGVRVEEVEVD